MRKSERRNKKKNGRGLREIIRGLLQFSCSTLAPECSTPACHLSILVSPLSRDPHRAVPQPKKKEKEEAKWGVEVIRYYGADRTRNRGASSGLRMLGADR